MSRVWRRLALLACLALVAPRLAAAAEPGVDPHAVYEKSCLSCHNEHAGDMSRQRLAVSKPKETLIVSRTGTGVEQLLKKHHGVKLSAAEAAAIIELFKKGLTWGGVFQHRCARCHGRAADFARATLTLADGRVRTQKGQTDVGAFLATHGEATATEIETLLEMLRYQVETKPK